MAQADGPDLIEIFAYIAGYRCAGGAISAVSCLVGITRSRAPKSGPDDTRYPLWPQPVIATTPLNASDGDIHPSVCRGRPLSDRAMALSCDCVTVDMSVLLGRY